MKKEEHRSHNDAGISSPLNIDRREFLKRMGVLGGGIIVYCAIGDSIASAAQMPQMPGFGNTPVDYNAFIRIGTDERVTCFVGKIDMGQGTITSFPQIVAEELDVAYGSIDIIMGDTDLCPYDFGTVGSMSIRMVGVQVRNAACEARGVLKGLAAEYLKCPVDRLQTKDGVVFDKTSPDKKVTYGALTKGKVIERHLKELPPLKSPSEFTVMGKPYFHQDARDKVTGRAKYAGDIRLPGMLYAAILKPPAHGAKLKSLDVSEARKLKDVMVVQEDDLVAVLHRFPDEAAKALTWIKAEYDMPKTGLNDKTIYDHFLKVPVEANVLNQQGDVANGRGLAKEIFEETYLGPYLAHMPMETHTAIANIENGKVTVRSSTQNPFPLQESIAKTLGLPKEKVRVITPFVGGGFGGKGHPNPNRESLAAARLAKLTGKPVQVCHTREEEIYYDTFRPAAVVKIKSGLDGSGNIVFWEYDVYMAGDRCAEVLYSVPHHLVKVHGGWMQPPEGAHPFGVGPWRAPGAPNNIHAKELHMNIMAAKAGVDPLEFRIKHLKDERMINVLKAVADKFGYKPAKLPSGRGIGMSCAIDANTYVAHMAEIALDKASGKVEVKRIVCGYDMGLCVNPQGTSIQMEGCCMMGLGYALTEGLRFSNGEIFDRNFDTYHIPRFSWLPKIETIIMDNMDKAPQGGGEPGIVGIGAIIANGIHDATGARLFNMPMTPERVKEALKKV
jgi:nicotinate dehydrogenase subunit B